MLEFKNVCVGLADGTQSAPFSLVVNGGETVCLSGPGGSGKTRLLMAVMGLAPLAAGYITVDGELVTPGSGSYFRQLMAYVPQQPPWNTLTVAELCRQLFALKVNRARAFDRPALMARWRQLGVDERCYDRATQTLTRPQLQLVLLSMLPLLGRPMVLLDEIPQTPAVQALLHQLTADGAEVVCTCREPLHGSGAEADEGTPTAFDKMIKL